METVKMHGDVLISPMVSLPDGVKPVPKRKVGSNPKADFILAEGEVTGHAHRIKADNGEAELYERNGTLYLKVRQPVEVTHEEHLPGVIEPGVYEIGFQREYDPYKKAARAVMD